MRVVVIGGGIAGASAACFLAERAEVVVLEREAICGYHTSGRSAALLTEAWEHGVPGMLTVASRDFLESPPEGFVDHPILSPLAVLIVGGEDQRDEVVAMAAEASSRTTVEVLEGAELRSAFPFLGPGVVVGVLERGGREIDVGTLHHGFLNRARSLGAHIITDAEVVSIEGRGEGWRIAHGTGAVDADVVVNASGAWGDVVGSMAGARPLGLQPFRRTAFLFDPKTDVSTWPMVIDSREQWYFKPERTQVMGSLAEETPMAPHDVQAEEIDVALAIDRIQQATDLRIVSVKRTWAGLRTFATDRDPVNGFDPDLPGFYWLVGQGGFGIMTSPAMGRVAAALILDGALPPDLAARGLTTEALSPSRFR